MNPTEPDSRFPSGPWTGFFLQPPVTERHWMELILTFREGTMTGEGRDRVGDFLIKGRYQVDDGRCWWTKSYLKKHSIAYQGYNEGKGIWGIWEYSANWKGGFHIWPVGMSDPTHSHLTEAIDEPVPSLDLPEFVPSDAPAEVIVTVFSRFGEKLTVLRDIRSNQ